MNLILQFIKSRWIFLGVSTFSLLITCDKEKSDQNCIDKNKIKLDQACIEIYQPVCGCDQKTYANSCFAEINGLTQWTDGACNP